MRHPLLYQINTRCWLQDLSSQSGRPVTLASVPESEFKFWRDGGFTHLWLMGVWTTGTTARKIAQEHPDLQLEYDRVLPGWTREDVVGSPYSIADYSVPTTLGGDAGLAAFRDRLAQLGLKLILDFVPNHVGVDHPWVSSRPELFVQSPDPIAGTFSVVTRTGTLALANGKDPYFPAWTDVAQLDYRKSETRQAMIALLQSIGSKCDGVRCDMAMLLLNDVFDQTWAHLPAHGPRPTEEFWPGAIAAVKREHPGFLFLAEVYWGLEGRLQQLGFDYTYDKALYDDLLARHAAEAQRKLLSHPRSYLERSVHFLENHDEPRVAEKLTPPENRAAALAILGLPGMRFLHEGQLAGARTKIPVQLGRRPKEQVLPEVAGNYRELLAALGKSWVGQGDGLLLSPRAAWDGNPTHQNFVVVYWPGPESSFDLVVVNLAAHRSQCYVFLPAAGLEEHYWSMQDSLGPEEYEKVGSDLLQSGLYLDLAAHAAQIFRFRPVS